MNGVTTSMYSVFYIDDNLEAQAHRVAREWWSRNNGEFTPPERGYWLLAQEKRGRVVACMSFENAGERAMTITGLYAEDARVGKIGSGAILERIHQIADREGAALYGITDSRAILEHALRRGWAISGVAIYRPIKES